MKRVSYKFGNYQRKKWLAAFKLQITELGHLKPPIIIYRNALQSIY